MKNTKEKISNIYNQNIEKYTIQQSSIKKKALAMALFRGFSFIGALVCAIFLFRFGVFYSVSTAILLLGIFGIFVKHHNKQRERLQHIKKLIEINKTELNALKGDVEKLDAGDEFVSHNHRFTYDLDVFGKGSVFQYINRAGTWFGKQVLAGWLQNPLTERQQIEKRQDAIKELTERLNWRQNYQAIGLQIPVSGSKTNNKANTDFFAFQFDKEWLAKWLSEPPKFYNKAVYKIMLLVLPVLALLILFLSIAGIIPYSGFVIFAVVQLFIIAINMKTISEKHSKVSKSYKVLKRYASLLQAISEEKYQSDFLNQLQKKLLTNQSTAHQSLQRLAKIVNALDNRLNLLFAVIADVFLLWDLQCMVRLEKWQEKHKACLQTWFDVIGIFDAVSSLANLAYNHPEFCYPSIQNTSYKLQLKKGGHLLIYDDVRVDNDFAIKNNAEFAIVTGANMAGKSTFLRMVGLNLVLGMTGSVVCASEMDFEPVGIFTSIRVTDSIQKNESYFYAELKRLQNIITTLKKNEQLFVVIDEMLRGTNSNDKHHGSVGYIKQLIRLRGKGIIATHDVALGEMEKQYNGNIKNYRFEVEIKGRKLNFDYQLQPGISQNLNATFLMQKMGIIMKDDPEIKK